jgi:hypothetical protein
MKLLDQKQAQSNLKTQNDELIGTNIRLRRFWQEITQKLNTIRENYDPDKLKRLKDFEQFCKDLIIKKSKMLEELVSIEKQIENKKEIYYGLIAKQDKLDEYVYEIQEKEKKLKLREAFVIDLEAKWKSTN